MTTRPAVLLIALLIALASGLTACGGGGGGGSSASSFCSLVKGDAKKFAASSSAADSLSAFEKIESKAPSAIKSDMKTLVNFVKSTASQALAGARRPHEARDRVEERRATYVKDKCKFDLNKS